MKWMVSGYEGLTEVSDDKTIARVEECRVELKGEVGSALERGRIGAGVMTGAST